MADMSIKQQSASTHYRLSMRTPQRAKRLENNIAPENLKPRLKFYQDRNYLIEKIELVTKTLEIETKEIPVTDFIPAPEAEKPKVKKTKTYEVWVKTEGQEDRRVARRTKKQALALRDSAQVRNEYDRRCFGKSVRTKEYYVVKVTTKHERI